MERIEKLISDIQYKIEDARAHNGMYSSNHTELETLLSLIETQKKENSDLRKKQLEEYDTLKQSFEHDKKVQGDLLDKYKNFVDAFPTLQHNLSQLADNKGNVQWSMISAMMDGYLEGFEQMK